MLSRRNLLTGTIGTGLVLTAGHPKRAAAQYLGDELGLLLQLGLVGTLQA